MKYLFEVSWEVCNKVGGIHTVISSKFEEAKKICENYFFIGPYFEVNKDFREEAPPEEFKQIFDKLKRKKVHCYYGKWALNEANTILIDSRELMSEKNSIKTQLWESFGIDSLFSGFDFEEPVVWSWAVGMFLEEFGQREEKTIVQFHEWLTGCGILYLKKMKSKIATVFTTHATVLERALAPEKRHFTEGNPEEEARRLKVIDKHLVEKGSALNCTVFTTVSNLVADSCEKIFRRRPEVIVYNGLDLSQKYDYANSRKKLEEFTKSFFYPYYFIDINKTSFYFISGRYEVSSKGVDLFIKSLGRMNEKMRQEGSDKNIVVFFLIPAATKKVYEEVLNNYVLFTKMNEKISEKKDEVEEGIVEAFLFRKKGLSSLLEEFTSSFKIKRKDGPPYVTTHELTFPNDEIFRLLKENKLDNEESDKIKVIYYPDYVEEGDGLLNLSYYEFTEGFDLGVFPSFYEPWGYTPLEGIYLGVPTITTDLSGFGRHIKDKENTGVTVINRRDKNEAETAEVLEKELFSYMNLTKEEKMKQRIEAEIFAKNFSWKVLIKNYIRAYELAEKKIKQENL